MRMNQKLSLMLLIKLAFLGSILSNIVVENPKSLKDQIWLRNSKLPKKRTQGQMDYSIANFGKIDFLKKEKMKVIVQSSNLNGCAPFDPIPSQKMPFALLMKRGDCTFSLKTHHAYSVKIF